MRRKPVEERRRRRERSSMQVGLRCTTLLDERHWDMNTLMHNFAAYCRLTLCAGFRGFKNRNYRSLLRGKRSSNIRKSLPASTTFLLKAVAQSVLLDRFWGAYRMSTDHVWASFCPVVSDVVSGHQRRRTVRYTILQLDLSQRLRYPLRPSSNSIQFISKFLVRTSIYPQDFVSHRFDVCLCERLCIVGGTGVDGYGLESFDGTFGWNWIFVVQGESVEFSEWHGSHEIDIIR